MQKRTFNPKIGNQMQNLYCRNVRNVKFPKIAFYTFELRLYKDKIEPSNNWYQIALHDYFEPTCILDPFSMKIPAGQSFRWGFSLIDAYSR